MSAKFSSLAVANAMALFTSAAYADGSAAPNFFDASVTEAQKPAAHMSWESVYAGASLGYALHGADRVILWMDSEYSPYYKHGIEVGTLRTKGFFWALRGGYRWEQGDWVFGPELEVHGGDVGDHYAIFETGQRSRNPGIRSWYDRILLIAIK